MIQNFLPEFQSYDVIIGYRADDSYFSFARSFVSNEISLKQLGYAMKLGKLGEQFVLKSQKAFESIRFLNYARRKVRDNKARDAYNKELENEDLDGIFMRDIIRKEIKPNDPRLH